MSADSQQLAEELHARRRDLEMVVRAVHRLIRYTEPRPLFEAIARVGADALGTNKCAVLIKPENREELLIAGSLGLSQGLVDFVDQHGVPLDSDVPSAVAYREQRPVSLSQVQTDEAIPPAFRELAARDDFDALLCCPVVAEGVAMGVLTVYFREARNFHPAETRRLTLLAEICAVAVQNARAFDNTRALAEELARKAAILERRNAELRIIADIAPVLAVAESPRQILSAFFSHTVAHVPFEQAALLLLDPANPKELVIREVHSTSPASFNRGWRVNWDGTLAEEPMLARKATWRQLSPGGSPGPITRYGLQIGLRSLAFFPVLAGSAVRGVLLVGSMRPDALDAAAVEMLEPIVAQLSSTLAKLEPVEA